MRKLFASLTLAAALSACAGMPRLDVCKYASARRLIYTTTIRAADAYALSGRAVPYELALGRRAAVTALEVLNVNCPEPERPPAA